MKKGVDLMYLDEEILERIRLAYADVSQISEKFLSAEDAFIGFSLKGLSVKDIISLAS